MFDDFDDEELFEGIDSDIREKLTDLLLSSMAPQPLELHRSNDAAVLCCRNLDHMLIRVKSNGIDVILNIDSSLIIDFRQNVLPSIIDWEKAISEDMKNRNFSTLQILTDGITEIANGNDLGVVASNMHIALENASTEIERSAVKLQIAEVLTNFVTRHEANYTTPEAMLAEAFNF